MSEIDFDEYEKLSYETNYGINIHPTWLITYLNKFNFNGNELFLELYDNSECDLKGVLPLVIQETRDNRFIKLNRLIPIGYRPTDFFPIVIKSGYEDDFSKLISEWFNNNSSIWDSIYINYIPKNYSLWKSLVKEFIKLGYNVNVKDDKKFLTIDTSGNYDSYLGKLGKKKAKYLRYNKRRLEREIGVIEYQEIENNIESYFEEFLKLYNNIKKNLNQSDPFDRVKGLKEFTRNVLIEYQKKKWIKLDIIKCNGEKIAFCYYFYFNGIMYYSMPTYDHHYGKYSPGSILLEFLIEKAFNDPKIKEFNFMRSVYDYKLWWKPKHESYIEILVQNKYSLKRILNNIIVNLKNFKNLLTG